MKTIGNREKEDGDDKKHKGRDENCRKHRRNDDTTMTKNADIAMWKMMRSTKIEMWRMRRN